MIALKRYSSEFSGIWALCIYSLSKEQGHVIDEDSAITTDLPSFSWSVLLFSMLMVT